MSSITSEQESSLLETIKTGTGYPGWRSAIATHFHSSTEYQFMVGGQWGFRSFIYTSLGHTRADFEVLNAPEIVWHGMVWTNQIHEFTL